MLVIWESLNMFNTNEIDDIVVSGIDMKDYPDFCDAYIESCSYYGKDMTEKQLDDLHEYESEFVYRVALINALES